MLNRQSRRRDRQGSSRVSRRLFLGSLAIVSGCARDLTRIHAPDLFHVRESDAARRSSLARPPLSQRSLPIPPGKQWQVHSTLSPRAALHDEDPNSVAIAPRPASLDQYVLIDVGCLADFSSVTQEHGETGGHPKRYRVDVAGEHNFPYDLVYVGPGESTRSIASWKRPVRARFLRITLLEPCDQPWSIAEIIVT